MFKSQFSGKQYDKNVKPVRVVVETRHKSYVNENGLVSHGYEIVREMVVGSDEVDQVKSK